MHRTSRTQRTRTATRTSGIAPRPAATRTGRPWTFTSTSNTGDGAALAANGSTFGNPNAPVGTQAAFLQRKGSISQTVSLAAGTYVLGFQAAQRPGNSQIP